MRASYTIAVEPSYFSILVETFPFQDNHFQRIFSTFLMTFQYLDPDCCGKKTFQYFFYSFHFFLDFNEKVVHRNSSFDDNVQIPPHDVFDKNSTGLVT